MSLSFYMNHHVRAEITDGLRRRGVDVITAHQDGRRRADDPALLDRATELGRVLFSQDSDLLVEASERQRIGQAFGGLIYVHQLGITIGRCIDDLELVCAAYEPEEIANKVVYLPL